jgi:hypothetical protein
MLHARYVMLALVAALPAIGFSPAARAQGTAPGTVVGAPTSDDVVVRPKLDVEMSRLKASTQTSPVVQRPVDLVTPAVKSAQDLMQAKKYPEALLKLSELDALADKSAGETFLIERTRVALASLAGDEALLIKSMEAVVASGQAPANERLEFAEVLVRKYFNQKNYPKAIAWSTRYFEEGGNDAAIRRAQVFSYYFNNDYARAGIEVGIDIDAEEKAGKIPSEEQLRLLVSCAQKQDDKAAYASAIKKYATYYPTAR